MMMLWPTGGTFDFQYQDRPGSITMDGELSTLIWAESSSVFLDSSIKFWIDFYHLDRIGLCLSNMLYLDYDSGQQPTRCAAIML